MFIFVTDGAPPGCFGVWILFEVTTVPPPWPRVW